MTDTEPDPAERASLGAALTAPGGTLTRTERDAVLADLGQLLEILGLGNHARPESPHEVFQQCLKAIMERENAVTWNTSCTACATVLDSSIMEHNRAERAEAKLATATAEAAVAEKKRIAQVARDLGAHYHTGDGAHSAPFDRFLRTESASANTSANPPPARSVDRLGETESGPGPLPGERRNPS